MQSNNKKNNKKKINEKKKQLQLKKYKMTNDHTENIAKNLPFPNFFEKVFVITIDPARYDRFNKRISDWKKYMTMWPGTRGKNVKLVNKNPKLNSGQLGCYESHYNIWKHMVEQNYDNVLILEDDVDIVYCERQSKALSDAVTILTQKKNEWDIFYFFFHSVDVTTSAQFANRCETTCGYVITLQGAKKLLQHAVPIKEPVDVFLQQMHLQQHIRSWRLHKRIAWQWSLVDHFHRHTLT